MTSPRLLPAILLAFSVSALTPGCDKSGTTPDEVGGTCESMGGFSCNCLDGTTRCTDRLPCPCDDGDVDTTPKRVGGEPTQPLERIPFPSNDVTCGPDAAKPVDKWLGAYLDWSTHVHTDMKASGLVELPRPTAANKDADPFLLRVETEATYFQDKRVDDIQLGDEHNESVKRKKREAKLLGIEWSHPGIAVAFEANTSWKRITWAFEHARKLDPSAVIYLAFRSTRPDNLGMPPAELMDEINAHYSIRDSVESPRHAASTAGCDKMVTLWRGLEKMPPRMRDAALAKQLGQTWVECSCEPDIEWLLGKQVVSTEDAVALVEIKLGEGTPVAHAADETWNATHLSLLNIDGPVQPVIATP